jgi:hypothetical protein
MFEYARNVYVNMYAYMFVCIGLSVFVLMGKFVAV